MVVVLEKIIAAYEEKVPLALALASDANGLKIGSPAKQITKILGCLELTPAVAKYAIQEKIDCLFVHHDPFYVPLHALREDDVHAQTILQLIKHDIALYVSHTNLDIVTNGLNDYLFTLLGGTQPRILEEATGIGRYGTLAKKVALADYLQQFVEPLQQKFRIIANNLETEVKTIAVVNGSGAQYFAQARQAGVDLFITGDIDYHTAMLAREYDVPLIDIGHDIEYLVHDVFTRIFTEIKKENQFDVMIVADFSFTFCPW